MTDRTWRHVAREIAEGPRQELTPRQFRHLVDALQGRDQPVPLCDVVDHLLVGHPEPIPVDDLQAEQRRLYEVLVHHTLPVLSEASLLTHDRAADTVRLTQFGERLLARDEKVRSPAPALVALRDERTRRRNGT